MSSKISSLNANGKKLSVVNSDLLDKDKNVVYLDTVDQATNYIGQDGDVIHISDKDRGGVFIYNYNAVHNGGTVFGHCDRQYDGAVNIKWFGAKGDGSNDDTLAIQNAIDFASSVVSNIVGDYNIVNNSVFIPNGRYKLTSALQLRNNIVIQGESKTTVELIVNHSGNGIESLFVSDYFEGIQVKSLSLTTSTGLAGIHGEGLIRNCRFTDVFCNGFDYGYYIEKSWTLKLDQCGAGNTNINHIYATDVGGLHIYGGRYDVSSSYGVYMVSNTGELYMNDVTVQYGDRAAVRTEGAYTTTLKDCFFEGNCIGSTTDYYIEIIGNGNVLSSSDINNCVMNNLADSNRDGLGVCYVDAVDDFKYKERWARNGASAIPIVGENVKKVYASYSSATDRTPLLTSNENNSEYVANIEQTARPKGIFGRDMNEISFSPTTYAALNVGRDNVGVAVGTYDNIGTVQSYGSGYKLKLNPRGDINFGVDGASLISNEWFGRYREATQLTSSNITPRSTTGYTGINCSDGNRGCTLTNIIPIAGRKIIIGKTDATTNTLTIYGNDDNTILINGASSYALNTEYAHIELISDGTNWFVKG